MLNRRKFSQWFSSVPAALLGFRSSPLLTKDKPKLFGEWRFVLPKAIDPRDAPHQSQEEILARLEVMKAKSYYLFMSLVETTKEPKDWHCHEFRKSLLMAGRLVCYRKTLLMWHEDAEGSKNGSYVPYGPGIGVDPIGLVENGTLYPEQEFKPWKPAPPVRFEIRCG